MPFTSSFLIALVSHWDKLLVTIITRFKLVTPFVMPSSIYYLKIGYIFTYFSIYFLVSSLLRDYSLRWDHWLGTWLLHLMRPCLHYSNVVHANHGSVNDISVVYHHCLYWHHLHWRCKNDQSLKNCNLAFCTAVVYLFFYASHYTGAKKWKAKIDSRKI